jgi:fatty acid desaturase
MELGTLIVLGGASVLLSCLFYFGQVIIHNCVHANQFQSRSLNKLVGGVICSLHLVHFEGWRIAHMMHHKHTNMEGDPHRVDRPLVPYLFTHYFRIARAVWEPRRFFLVITPPVATAIAVIAWQAAIGHAGRGITLVGMLWIVPLIASHLLVAHFNYATHVGLPPGRGRDTRNLSTGIYSILNRLMLNFYLHAEHHRRPSQAVPTIDAGLASSKREPERERELVT